MHPWQTDPSLWDALGQRVRAALPPHLQEETTLLGAGDTFIAFQAGDYIARLPRHDHAAKCLRREACFLPRIAADLPLDVPRPTLLTSTRTQLPPFALHRRVAGQELLLERWLALPRAQQQSFAHGVGSFLRALHSIAIETIAGCDVELTDPRLQVTQLREDAREQLMPLLTPPTVAALHEAFDRYTSGDTEWNYTPAITHCDVGPSHVLYDPDRAALTGVIDFGDVVIGDPARDFIFFREDWNDDFLQLALEAYELEPRTELLRRIEYSSLFNLVWWTTWVKGNGRTDLFEQGLQQLELETQTIT